MAFWHDTNSLLWNSKNRHWYVYVQELIDDVIKKEEIKIEKKVSRLGFEPRRFRIAALTLPLRPLGHLDTILSNPGQYILHASAVAHAFIFDAA